MARQFARLRHMLQMMGLKSPAPLASRIRHMQAKGIIPLYDPADLIV